MDSKSVRLVQDQDKALRTMRAARLHGIRDLRLEDLPRPTPCPGEVLLKVASVGTCGSDVHYYVDGRIGDQVVTAPIIMGHEFSAWIAELGAGACPEPVLSSRRRIEGPFDPSTRRSTLRTGSAQGRLRSG